jgi:hypothetical protein
VEKSLGTGIKTIISWIQQGVEQDIPNFVTANNNNYIVKTNANCLLTPEPIPESPKCNNYSSKLSLHSESDSESTECYNPHRYDPNYEISTTTKSQPYG